jgi:hypothetical protein
MTDAPVSAIAICSNPFVYENDYTPPVDPTSGLLAGRPIRCIYSADPEITISGDPNLTGYATIIPDGYDAEIYAIDVRLVASLKAAGGNIKICCRRLIIDGNANTDKGNIAIDVSGGEPAVGYQNSKQPDIRSVDSDPASGDLIAQQLSANPGGWGDWFTVDPQLYEWGKKGSSGGSILIACEQLVFNVGAAGSGGTLTLKANGARGNAGLGGQTRSTWAQGQVGGDAGKGGEGGDGGSVQVYFANAYDAGGSIATPEKWVVVDSSIWLTDDSDASAGAAGVSGKPGDAVDSLLVSHPGSEAPPVDSGADGEFDFTQVNTFDDLDPNRLTISIPDMSSVAGNAPAHFWGLFYHRMKIEYLGKQPKGYFRPDTTQSDWKALGDLLAWGHAFAYVYGLQSAQQKVAAFDITLDNEYAIKGYMQAAIVSMYNWYMQGRLLGGGSAILVPPLPLDTLAEMISDYTKNSSSIEQKYFQLKSDFINSVKIANTQTDMRNAADFEMQCHVARFQQLQSVLYGLATAAPDVKGPPKEPGNTSMVTQISDAQEACTVASDALAQALNDLGTAITDPARQKYGFSDISKIGDAIQSVLFVAGDPPVAIAMAGIQAAKLVFGGISDIETNSGVDMPRSMALKQVHQYSDNLHDMASLAVNISGDDERKLTETIVASLDQINDFVEQFTKALGDAEIDNVKARVSDLREQVDKRNGLWMNYNDLLLEASKEYGDYMAAKSRVQDMDKQLTQNIQPDQIRGILLNYTNIYLNSVENTASLMYQVLRKYAYLTLNKDLPADGDYIKINQAFWSADSAASVAGTADQATGDWWQDNNVIASNNSASIFNQLKTFKSDQSSIFMAEPEAGKKSGVFIRIDNTMMNGKGKKVLDRLLANQLVWLQVWPSTTKGPDGHFIWFADPAHAPQSGEVENTTLPTNYPPPSFYPGAKNLNLSCCFAPLEDIFPRWNYRVRAVWPWLYGVQSTSNKLYFEVTIASCHLIMQDYQSSSDVMQDGFYFDNNGNALHTEFAHFLGANNLPGNISDDLRDPTVNAGAISDDFIDTRGVFMQVGLKLPVDLPDYNKDLAVIAGDTAELRVYFNVNYQMSSKT